MHTIGFIRPYPLNHGVLSGALPFGATVTLSVNFSFVCSKQRCTLFFTKRVCALGFPGSPVVQNLPCNAAQSLVREDLPHTTKPMSSY